MLPRNHKERIAFIWRIDFDLVAEFFQSHELFSVNICITEVSTSVAFTCILFDFFKYFFSRQSWPLFWSQFESILGRHVICFRSLDISFSFHDRIFLSFEYFTHMSVPLYKFNSGAYASEFLTIPRRNYNMLLEKYNIVNIISQEHFVLFIIQRISFWFFSLFKIISFMII